MKLFQLRLQLVFQLQGDVGIFGSILIDLGGGEVAHAALGLALGSNQLVDVDGLIVQVDLGHVVHVVTKLWLDEVVGNHRVPHGTLQFDVVIP